MNHSNKLRKFGRKKKVRDALVKSLARSLFIRGRITTTEAKAKSLRPVVEKLVSKGKNPTLANQRIILSTLGNQSLKRVAEISEKYTDRKGGYTRITKINDRKSDGSPMAVIEFI